MNPPESLQAWLRRVTLLYLALPVVIFFAGWLRLPLAILGGGLLLAAIWPFRRPGRSEAPEPAESCVPLSWRGWCLAIVLPAALLTLLSGAGGWGSGDSDWLKHDTILRDLLVRTWPVTYESGHGPILLVYYVAFYLPAALVGKVAGGSWLVASQTLAFTTFLGLVLSAAWMVVLATAADHPPSAKTAPDAGQTLLSARTSALVAAAIFWGFSGLDVLGKMGVNLYLHLPAVYGDWNDIAWWAQFAQYSANAASVFWAPQHAFGGWLPVALALDDFQRRGGPERRAVLYVALALAWSPFAAAGLLPLAAGMMLWRWRGALKAEVSTAMPAAMSGSMSTLAHGLSWWRCTFTIENLAGVVTGGVLALFLAAHFSDYPLDARYRVTPGFHPMPLLREMSRFWLYLMFVSLEFAGLSAAAAIYFVSGRRKTEERPELSLLVLATAVLLLLPCFRYGYANDLVMRGGIPALFTLQIVLARMFAHAPRTLSRASRFALLLAAGLLLGGLGNTFLEYRRHVVRIIAQGSCRDVRTREPVRSLAQLHRTIYARPGFDFARQYLGSVDSPFVRYAAARRGALGSTPPPHGPPDF